MTEGVRVAKRGRPATNKSAAAKKHAAAEKKRYQSLPVSKRQSIVQTRDKEAQRRADEKRASQPARKAYKKQDAKAVSKVPKGKVCAVCGSKVNVQRHVVNGKFKEYLCGRHNVAAIGK
jgi:hypothetical protein